jgi:PAS domain S-box-containing protein
LDVPDLEPLRSALEPHTEADPRSEALRRMVAQLVLETTSEGIWLIDAQARTTFVNAHAAALLGYTEAEMIGKHIFTFLQEKRWPIAQQNLRRRRLGAEDRQEVELVRKDGTRVWVLGSANPVYGRDGSYAGSLALFGDLSVQKRRERRLRAEVQALRRRASLLVARRAPRPPEPPAVAAPEPPPYAEPFRSAILLGTCGAFVATVALLTASAVASTLVGKSAPREEGD